MNVSEKIPLALILSSATLTVMAGSIIAPVLNLMRDGLHVGPSYVGLIITTHGLFMAIFSPFMGSIIDRRGARRPFIVGLIIFGIAGGSGLLISSYGVLLISRACLGISLAGIFTAINVLILNMYEGAERDRVMGWRGSAQSLGGIIWPMIGGILGGLSWHMPFAVYLIAIPIGLLALARLPEPEIHLGHGPEAVGGMSVLQVLRGSPVLLFINGLVFFSNVQLYVIVIFLPQLLETFGVSSTFQISLFITIMAAAAGTIAFFYGRIRTRMTYRTIALIAVMLWAISFASVSRAPSILAIALSVALFGAGQGLIMPTVMAWIGDAVPVSFRGRFSSYLGTFGFIGQFLSPILFAPVLILVGLNNVFMVSAGVGAVWFLLLFFLLRR